MNDLKKEIIVGVLGDFKNIKDFCYFILSIALLILCSVLSIVLVGTISRILALLPISNVGLPIYILAIILLTILGYIFFEILFTVYLYKSKYALEIFNAQLKRLRNLLDVSLMILAFIVLLFLVTIEVDEIISKINMYHLMILWILLLPGISVIRRNSK